MEVRANEKGYHNGHNSIFLKGNYDKKNCSFERTSEELIDGGLDFYAPQTLESKDGRRIMIGWMQNWENKIQKKLKKVHSSLAFLLFNSTQPQWP